jgi:hypothetical protein
MYDNNTAATTITHLIFSLMATPDEVSITHVKLCIQTDDKHT